MGFIKDILDGGAGKLVDSVTNLLDGVITTKEEKLQHELEMHKADLDHKKEMYKIDSEDRGSARQMHTNVQTSTAAPKLAKLIGPYLAIGATVMTFAFFFVILFKSEAIPMETKDIVMFILGALTTILVQIFSFYFGSSKGSEDKNEMISKNQKS